MKLTPIQKRLRAAAVLGLVSLSLMVWGLFDPTPWAIIVAMSVGQGLGILAFGALIATIVTEMLKRDRPGVSNPPPGPSVSDRKQS